MFSSRLHNSSLAKTSSCPWLCTFCWATHLLQHRRVDVFKSLINDRKPTFKQASCKTQPASPPYYQFRKFFFSMKSITRIDFNNARISCKKVSIFELNSLFLLMITFAFCIHSLILQTRVLQRSKTKKNVISYKNKFLKWLSDNRAQKFFSMNSVYAHIKVLDQRGTCKESICLRKENPVFSVKTRDFAHPLAHTPFALLSRLI